MSCTNLIGLQTSKDDKSLWNDHVPCTTEETRFFEQSNQTRFVKMLTNNLVTESFTLIRNKTNLQ